MTRNYSLFLTEKAELMLKNYIILYHNYQTCSLIGTMAVPNESMHNGNITTHVQTPRSHQDPDQMRSTEPKLDFLR